MKKLQNICTLNDNGLDTLKGLISSMIFVLDTQNSETHIEFKSYGKLASILVF